MQRCDIFFFFFNDTATTGIYTLSLNDALPICINQRVVEVIAKIRERDSGGSIGVIARYNYLIDDAKEALSNVGLKNNVSFWSYHKSKGLEADYCILIGFFQGRSGFPNENKDDAIIEALLPSLDRKSTRLNSSHKPISYAVFCLKKKTNHLHWPPPN